MSMKIRRSFRDLGAALPLFLFLNLPFVWIYMPVLNWFQKLMYTVLLLVCFIALCAIPHVNQWGSLRISSLSHGLAQLRQGMICVLAETVFYFAVLLNSSFGGWVHLILAGVNYLYYTIFIVTFFLIAIFRFGLAGRQLRWYWYVLLLLGWTFPGFNLLLLLKVYYTAKRELFEESARLELDEVRREEEVCATRYPILLVHGIFFRDWQYFNYWGRIPGALKKNGAAVFYGGQQSAQSIAKSAEEVNRRIHEILEETGAEKVNIIAHSKGGLDTRYAIAELGAGPYIASLTMINSPHHGCAWVDAILRIVPQGFVKWVSGRYNAIFRKLGDKEPDFLGGVMDLTAARCDAFNRKYPVCEDIPHHNVMSRMGFVFSAHFWFGCSFLISKIHDPFGKTDGLVPVRSAKLEGVPFTMLEPKGFRGISHGDVIDLTRENVRGFDVREFYVGLVKDLKERGL
ncbi:MAG: triacylglycerol lipase [Oscillospiraceae bacterium]|nr:triacylglycerol lipase [Oscillospiraceae bacterium]